MKMDEIIQEKREDQKEGYNQVLNRSTLRNQERKKSQQKEIGW